MGAKHGSLGPMKDLASAHWSLAQLEDGRFCAAIEHEPLPWTNMP